MFHRYAEEYQVFILELLSKLIINCIIASESSIRRVYYNLILISQINKS